MLKTVAMPRPVAIQRRNDNEELYESGQNLIGYPLRLRIVSQILASSKEASVEITVQKSFIGMVI
jgi:hypothetical protein